MAKTPSFFSPFLLFLVSAVIFQLSAVTSAIGINYGTMGNLPPSKQVVKFIKTKTIFDAVKIYDANPDILQALAGSGINVTIMVPNDRIPAMAQAENARQWIAANVLPFHQQLKIKYICVGNEILMTEDNNLISNLVPAMQSLNDALKTSGLTYIKVTTPHAFTINYNHDAPSESEFTDDQKDFFAKILEFNRQAKSPFMFSAYPFFMTDESNVNFAIFGSSHTLMDANTKHIYDNMFDAVMDATYSAMKSLGYGDVDIAVGETGWPSVCEASWCTPQNAAKYNLHIIKRGQSINTPLMPNRHIDIFIFALFNEDGKPGLREKNWGLFKPDFTPVYDVGVLRGGGDTPSESKKWCVAKKEATNTQLQANIDWTCSQADVDCKQISPGGICFDNNNMKSRASFIMNVYYQSKGLSEEACNFSGSGTVTTTNPSTRSCVMPNGLGGSYVGSTSGTSTSDSRSARRKACGAKEGATDAQLQANIDYVCSQPGIDCRGIAPGGICYDNNNKKTQASFIMNVYYQMKGCSEEACDFSGSGTVTSVDPSRDANSPACPVTINPYNDACVARNALSGPYVGRSSSVGAWSRKNLVTKWCVPKPDTSKAQLQENIDLICNTDGMFCEAILPGGYCANESLETRAAFVMSAYFVNSGLDASACDTFNGSGIVSTINPSTKSCFISGVPGLV
ncbi:unnamed protein product [Thlaspi arvense]|uniref:glucan endo-1,3-beta-D-glucosidase n=1 Tax=Thlaspi arvense TaxID=13288 RepID=A0AAU9S9K0_THLAR|nr:unnamed protein product [Thlaspi arvense]